MRKFACRTPTLLSGAVLAVTWVALCPVLAGLLKASAHVPRYQAAARAEAAKYRGVSYFKRGRVFVSWLEVEAGPGYIGRFKNAKQAAEAYDGELRRMYPDDTPDHKFRRKSWLNFPSEQEAAYTESPEQARKRGLKLGGSSFRKEARSFELLREAFCESPYSENYELVRLTGSSKADVLFKPRGASKVGLQVQLKAATSGWEQGKTYKFRNLLGYDGMLVFLVALDGGHFWAAAGEEFKTCQLQITIGCASDTCRRVEDTGARLIACFKNTRKFPHISIEEAKCQCSVTYRVEAVAHRQLRSLFDCMNWSLICPREHQTTVDSLLEVRNGRPRVRLQEKASNFHENIGRYRVQMSKCGGSLGRLPYVKDDFDLLVACVLHKDQLQGVFLIPVSKLVQKGFVAKSPCNLPLHPPWSPPKWNRTKQKYVWQLDWFLDLRTWCDSEELPEELKRRLQQLISKGLKGFAGTHDPGFEIRLLPSGNRAAPETSDTFSNPQRLHSLLRQHHVYETLEPCS